MELIWKPVFYMEPLRIPSRRTNESPFKVLDEMFVPECVKAVFHCVLVSFPLSINIYLSLYFSFSDSLNMSCFSHSLSVCLSVPLNYIITPT